MIFYLSMAILFTIYALDLLLLVITAAIARSAEVAALVRKRSSERRSKKAQKALQEKAAAAAAGAEGGSGAGAVVAAAGTTTAAATAPAVAGGAPRFGAAAAAPVVNSELRISPSGSSGYSSTVADSSLDDESDEDGVPRAEIITTAPAGTAITLPDDPWGGGKAPKVLIQLPMYNEEAHAAAIINACCRIKYPRDRLLIQVLDDSTKEAVRQKVDAAAALCIENGQPVQVMRRDNRSGFKAGAMVEGLNRVEGLGYEYCAIFDADFDPPADFLEETIPPMHRDKTLAYVQTRWAFTNGNESFLTWAQKVNLSFHFDVEQRARSFLGWFFNFNGTAGVWRIQSIHDAGGWQSDTVVEDMDLSLRCYLKGWNAIYLPHVDNNNELPCTLSSYKTQQFRWLSGPMQILVKSFKNIIHAKNISFARRANAFWFFLRYMLFAAITVGVLAVPPVALWVEVWAWDWPHIYFIVAINFALAVFLYVTPFSIAYLFFSVAVGYMKLWAMISGLIGLEKSKTWKVTQKYGAKQASVGLLQRMTAHKPYALEACLALYYGGLAAAAGVYASWIMLGYCALMCLVFLFISFGDAYM
ncbi:putative xyloglucan glycosyltransferase 6 [Tetrabaena socialis]|uniref:glucomannan 4-beta-mannosyltransferase n=1 Tax=Tetrabaena socialis TaxID=47790 RepID=A0A2J7ZTP9_9CHLO|nr:putative xyloglucan glycosyltransferase 6 [Tetrabaena socialis]|eukprot:PNH03644.1 putative xyloglucan glycosyltransferase 6 [Tetrabaena socialis]